MTVLTTQDFDEAKLDIAFVRAWSSSLNAYEVDRFGRSRRTIEGLLQFMSDNITYLLSGQGYVPPVAYAAGLGLTTTVQTVEYSGAIYRARKESLPYTTPATFDPTKFWLVQDANSAMGNVAYVSRTGTDSSGVVGNMRRAFRQVNAALAALVGINGPVVVEILDGTAADYAPVTTDNNVGSLLRNNLTMRCAQRGWFNATCTAIDGVAIPGPFVVDTSRRTGFRWENLGCDSGKTITDALYASVAQDGLILVNLPQTAGIVGMRAPVIDRPICLCRDDNVSVHALLIEATSTAVINDPVTCYGLHGGVVKSTLTTWRGGRHYRCNGEAFIVKGDAYAKCDGGQYGDLILGGSPEGTTPWYAGTDLVGLKINPQGAAVTNQQFGAVSIRDVSFGVKFEMGGPNAENISLRELSMTNVASVGVLIDGAGTVVDPNIGTIRMSSCPAVAFAVGTTPMLRAKIKEIIALNSGGAFDMSASGQDLSVDLVQVRSIVAGAYIYRLGSGRVRVGREDIHPASLSQKWHPASKPTYATGWTTQVSGATEPTVNLEGYGVALYGRANNAGGGATILQMPLVLYPGTADGSYRTTVRGNLTSGVACQVGIVVGNGGGLCVVTVETVNGTAPVMANLAWVELTGIRWTY